MNSTLFKLVRCHLMNLMLTLLKDFSLLIQILVYFSNKKWKPNNELWNNQIWSLFFQGSNEMWASRCFVNSQMLKKCKTVLCSQVILGIQNNETWNHTVVRKVHLQSLLLCLQNLNTASGFRRLKMFWASRKETGWLSWERHPPGLRC